MSSPPLAPDDGPINFEHLSRMTLDDPALECEVLTMFVTQSAKLLDQIAALPPEAASLAHTLKGSARAIGAFAVAEAAACLETALAGQGDRPLVSNRRGTTGMNERYLERLTRARQEHLLAPLRPALSAETAEKSAEPEVPSAASVSVALVG